MINRTALFDAHQKAQAKIVPFAGWEMPLHYGSSLAEHHAVRTALGVFDVSHMNVIDLFGPSSKPFLQFLIANDVAKLKTMGKALYGCMLNEKGGVKDDLIVYWLGDNHYRVILNAGTKEKDMAWLTEVAHSFKELDIKEQKNQSLLAIQGPQALPKLTEIFPEMETLFKTLSPFASTIQNGWFFARTGYTGEDGFEILLPSSDAVSLWDSLLNAGVTPCGLGARDLLRLEAGMHLYGVDLDEEHSPLESGLDWTVSLDTPRNFMGKEALLTQKSKGDLPQWVGLILEPKGVLRNHLRVKIENVREGEITSGGFSPVLNRGIAFARLPNSSATNCLVEIRGKFLPAKVVKLPFVRNGKTLYTDRE